MTFLSLLIGLGTLVWSGWATGRQVLPAEERALRLILALPFGSLLHVIILCVLSLLHVPLAWWILLPLHAVLGLVLLFLPTSFRPRGPIIGAAPMLPHRPATILRTVCIALLSVQFLYAGAHAVILPTYHIDSLTNWTMRAKVSWLDSSMALDTTEERGVAKPQYPFLVHGLQMMGNVVAPAWSDRAANTATFLLTLTSLGGLFLILQRLRGKTVALVALASITSIPLLSFHLAQGYGDIHLITYLLLALAFVLVARTSNDPRWTMGSALLIGAASWTKTEGAIIGLLPWLFLIGIDLPYPEGRRERIAAMVKALSISLLLPLFLFLNKLPFSPHASADARIAFHPEAFGPALGGFLSPSMGLMWVALAAALLIVFRLWRRNDPRIDCRVIITYGWGLLALVIVLATYTLTHNVLFLLNGESYFRQLLIPATLLILSLSVSLQKAETDQK